MQATNDRQSSSESGSVLVFFCLCLAVLGGFTAYSIDLGAAYSEMRTVQNASDHAALAAAKAIAANLGNASAALEGRAVASLHGLTTAGTSSELVALECGECVDTSGGAADGFCESFTPEGFLWTRNGSPTGCAAGSFSAVRASAERVVATRFARLIHTSSITPNTSSIAVLTSALNCAVPFWIKDTALNGLELNDEFVVGPGTGNWGKLGIDGGFNQNSLANSNGNCAANLRVGGEVFTETGFSDIRNAFDNIFERPAAQGMIVAVTSADPNGHRLIPIVEFVQLNFIRHERNGDRWRGTFQVVARGVNPPTRPGAGGGARLGGGGPHA